MSATTANPVTEREHTPLTYNILTDAYSRLMHTDKKDWDLYMKLQQQDLLQEYGFYREIGKLIKRIAQKPKVHEFYRWIPAAPIIDQVAAAHRKYLDAVKAHFDEPERFPLPAPFQMPTPPEGHWELVIETDLRNQEQALELLRMRWMDNPATTARHIAEFLADFPVYRTDGDHFRTDIVKNILRQATRQLAAQGPVTLDWEAYEALYKAQKDPEKARKAAKAAAKAAKPQMRQVPMLPKDGNPFSIAVPGNLTLMETDFDLYQRHETWVYVAGDDGKLVGLRLDLDNNFARLKSNNRTYKAEKYNHRYEAMLHDSSIPDHPIQRSLRFLAHQVAEGRKVKIVTDRSAAHGHMVIQAVAALVPTEQAKLRKAARQATRHAGTHNMDDRDYIDEYDRPTRHIWKSRQYTPVNYWTWQAQTLHGAEGPVKLSDLDNNYWARRKEVLGAAEGPVPMPLTHVTKKDALEIKWWNLYWMPRRHLAYLVYSVRRFYDKNGIKKHVVIYQPLKVIKKMKDEGGIDQVRRNKAGWLIVDDSDLHQLCHSEQQLAQYDWDGNITGYSNYRRAPAAFRGELSAKFTTPLTAEEIKTLGKENIKPIRNYGRIVGWTRKPQPWDYNSRIRNTFALVLSIVRRSKPFQKAMETISRWEYEKDHRFEHKTLKNTTLEFAGTDKKVYHEDETELSNGRFDRNDDILNPTYEEFVEATMYAEGARDGLDLLADGEISLATAAELAAITTKPARRQQEQMVEEVLDRQLRELREKDQKKDDLRRAEQLIEILAMLKRHPELEAHLSRELNPGTHICKIWNIANPKADGYVHTPLSQMFHLHPITVRKDGVNLTPEQQAALPENEGRRYIAAEWVEQAQEELFVASAPNPWKKLAMRNGKRIYRFKRNYSKGSLRIIGKSETKPSGTLRKAA